MSFSMVGVNGEGATMVVNSEDLPQPPPTPSFPNNNINNNTPQPSDTTSTITPFSNFLNISSFANNFSSISTITTAPGFSTFSSPSWNPYAPAPEPPVDDHTALNTYNPSLAALNNNIANKNKRMWETPSLANAAAIRKKRKQNFFEEEEATCAKCHYRRKCMKCTNCFARFCEQRCLPRYLEDPGAQEEVRLTNSWLCPCCKGIEPPGKYKGSDILRKDVEEAKEKDDDDDDPKPSSNGTHIVPQQLPIQTHASPSQHSYYQEKYNSNFQVQQQLQLQQHQQQQQLKMQQMHLQQQQQLQQQQIQLQQQQLQQQLLQQQHQQHQQMQHLQHMQHSQHIQQQQQMQFSPHPVPYQIQQQSLQPGALQSPIPPHLRQQGQSSPHPSSPLPHNNNNIIKPNPDAPLTRSASKSKPQNGGGVIDVGINQNGINNNNNNNNGSGNGIGGNGGAVVGVGEEADPNEYPKETEDCCSVCGDIFSYDDNNEIIYCDGCNVAVHQACYGVSKVPAGEWLCDRCKAKVLPTCYLCSQTGGAMKEFVDMPNHWVHLTCVATFYELSPLDFTKKLGPPGLLEKIDKKRYKLKCETCRETNRRDVTGPLMQCASKRCVKAFHPICAKKKLTYDKSLSIFVTYCKQHAAEAPQDAAQ